MISFKPSLESIAKNMSLFADSSKGSLVFNKRDVSYDIMTMNSYDSDFIWVLRPSGCALAPVRSGARPEIVTHWLSDDSVEVGIPYLISKNCTQIELIEIDEAVRLMNKLPAKISKKQNLIELISTVNNVLRSGAEAGTWIEVVKINDSFDNTPTTHWNEYFQYFSKTNSVMERFMEKAIMLRLKLRAEANGLVSQHD